LRASAIAAAAGCDRAVHGRTASESDASRWGPVAGTRGF